MKVISHKNELGFGIYTIPDISRLLKIERRKVTRYISEYWDENQGKKLFSDTYSWTINKRNKAVNFYVLIELFTFFELQKRGVKAKTILKARRSISKELSIEYPFASSKLLTDGKNIWYRFQDDIVNADGTSQTNFIQIIECFATMVDFFDDSFLARQFWPFGRNSSIVVDPHHQFGQPVINGTNINAEVIYSMFRSGEPTSALAVLYGLTEKEIDDAINFCRTAA
ncbi:MAG: DUF433 domain-containing protein [Bacteroidetes bacterium]|nr:DUF433 domain-containing protein [Bacteroidota bacterium]MBU1678069.1 DUF433 domain-containing protein [Bacteroidota bacterium]